LCHNTTPAIIKLGAFLFPLELRFSPTFLHRSSLFYYGVGRLHLFSSSVIFPVRTPLFVAAATTTQQAAHFLPAILVQDFVPSLPFFLHSVLSKAGLWLSFFVFCGDSSVAIQWQFSGNPAAT
jgi:hypothetical protein